MRLSECTKEEFLQIINRMEERSIVRLNREMTMTLNELNYVWEENQLTEAEEAEHVNQMAYNAGQKAYELLAPYEGIYLRDVPSEIIEQANEAIKDA